jgi:1,4-dihydroxy-2-naphthoate octaprenyltransferase
MGKKKTKIQKWLFAAKVNSSPKLLVAFFFGSSMGIHSTEWKTLIFSVGFLFSVSLLCYIVFLNDYADREVDRIKRTLFPNDCSPKTIPDKILPANQILKAGIGFGLTSLLIGFYLSVLTNRGLVLGIAVLCLCIFYLYSLPPFQLNYRGGGEILEMLGVSIVLPLFIFSTYSIAPKEILRYFPYFLCYLPLSLSSAIASGLSDEESDKKGGKNTVVTLFGNQKSKKMILLLFSFAIFPLLYLGFFQEVPLNFGFTFGILSIYFFQLLQIIKRSQGADTNHFDRLRIFKDHLHYGIWGIMIIVSMDLLLKRYRIFL